MKNFVLNSTCTFCDVRFIVNKCREMLNNTSMNRNKLESCLNLEPMPIFTVRSCSRQQPWHSNSSGLVWLLSPNITSIFEILNYKRNKKKTIKIWKWKDKLWSVDTRMLTFITSSSRLRVLFSTLKIYENPSLSHKSLPSNFKYSSSSVCWMTPSANNIYVYKR
jgi:hypothetical protein